MELSEIEQNMTVQDNAAEHQRAIMTELTKGSVDPVDALRLLMVYVLRYEKSKPALVAELRRFVAGKVGIPEPHMALVDQLLEFGGANVRTSDLFNPGGSAGGAGGFLAALTAPLRMAEVSGAANVFTQHQPSLVYTLADIAKNRLKTSLYTYAGSDPGPTRWSTVIVFVVGGVTYEEAAKVADINAGRLNITSPTPTPTPDARVAPPFRVLLGGTNILNSTTFLAELRRLKAGHTAIDIGAGVGAGGAAGGGGGVGEFK